MYVDRGNNGQIIRALRHPQRKGQEYIRDDDPHLVAFLNRPENLLKPVFTAGGEWVEGLSAAEIAKEELARTDLEMARGVEDLIEVLTAKGVINQTDLPTPLLEKIDKRKALRIQLK